MSRQNTEDSFSLSVRLPRLVVDRLDGICAALDLSRRQVLARIILDAGASTVHGLGASSRSEAAGRP